MTNSRAVGPVALVFVVITGLLSCAIGIGLLGRSETAFGKVWASAFVLFGVIVLVGGAVGSRPIRTGSPAAAAPGLVALILLAGWSATGAVVGAVQEHWAWAVLMGVPAAYLLWAAARVVRARARD